MLKKKKTTVCTGMNDDATVLIEELENWDSIPKNKQVGKIVYKWYRTMKVPSSVHQNLMELFGRYKYLKYTST